MRRARLTVPLTCLSSALLLAVTGAPLLTGTAAAAGPQPAAAAAAVGQPAVPPVDTG
jgi:hypothetical protein